MADEPNQPPRLPDVADPEAPTERREDMAGRRVTHYEVLERLGSGGMGVVYKARDTRLDRTVAIKFLPPELTRDPEAKARFVHEAQASSSLDHPAICTVHEIDESEDGHLFIVMAFVPGETLRQRVARRPLPLSEAIHIAEQVAEGLAHAHAQGIVHRDIKPANVIVTPGGDARIVDFGLAKRPDVNLTRTGVTLGTVSSMSPEQARGGEVDHRTDIWALGVVLYEMVTGQSPFRGDGAEAMIASILNDEPEPMTAVRSGVSILLDAIVAKMLAKDPDARYQHIDEIPVDLRVVETGPIPAPPAPDGSLPATPGLGFGRSLAMGVVAALAGLALWSALGAPTRESGNPVHFSIALPADRQLNSWFHPLALSPDGKLLAYSARIGRDSRLYVRALESLETTVVSGTEGAQSPFFSFDGAWIGFFADGQLKKIPVDGGIAQVICAAPQESRGASWGPDDAIIMSLGVTAGLQRVAADGGTPETLTVPDTAAGEIGHLWPQLLPGEGAVLFTIWTGDGWQSAVLDLAGGTWRVLLEDGAAARYVPTGHLMYGEMSIAAARPGLFAVPFDVSQLDIDGTPVSVLEGPGLAGPNFVVAPGGTLAYVASGSPAWAGLEESRLVWREADGRTTTVFEESGVFEAPRLSPDGTQVSFATFSPTGNYDAWTHDLGPGTRRRVSLRGSINNFPIWGPDASMLTFTSSRLPMGLYTKIVDGTGEAQRLVARQQHIQVPESWSAGGRMLAFTELNAEARGDIWIHTVGAGAVPLLATAADEKSARFSPTGPWLAFVSDESGRDQVYVRPYPGPGPTLPISVDGGGEPSWAPDGRTVFYRNGEMMMAVTLGDGTPTTAGPPRLLFEAPYQPGTFGHANYDVAADGRFLMVEPLDEPTPTLVNVVLNWFTQLESQVPSR